MLWVALISICLVFLVLVLLVWVMKLFGYVFTRRQAAATAAANKSAVVPGQIHDEEIAAIAAAHSSPQEAVDALVAAALDAGGTDNITVIVADMPLTEPEHHAFSAFRLDEGEDIGAIEDATLQTLRTIRSA